MQERFSIKLKPETLHFIPLPSRHVVDDSYWTHFTLLGQSLGSIYLAWQGLCGTDGLWGDIFLGQSSFGCQLDAICLTDRYYGLRLYIPSRATHCRVGHRHWYLHSLSYGQYRHGRTSEEPIIRFRECQRIKVMASNPSQIAVSYSNHLGAQADNLATIVYSPTYTQPVCSSPNIQWPIHHGPTRISIRSSIKAAQPSWRQCFCSTN